MSHPLRNTIPAAKCTECDHFAPVGEITECKRGGCACKRHTGERSGSPYRGNDPESPEGAEAALEYFKAEMEAARRELAQASDEEVAAELARDMTRARLMLSDECPVTGVFDGVRVTVGQRDAWLLLRTEDEEREYRLRKLARTAAEKRLEVLGRQAITQASIAKSVSTGYNLTRTGERW